MNDFDLTLNRIFTSRPNTNLFPQENLFSKFDDKKTENLRKGNMYVGSANDIYLQHMCEGFGENNGLCDRCGDLIMPWIKSGICEKCIEEMNYEDKEMPAWLKRNNSFNSPESSLWFLV